MIRYRHFALSNLYLRNGYKEYATPDGIEREYDREDQLEQCIRRILVRKPRRMRGWDIRFIRHGLGLSQSQFGKLVDRDSQTVARWEKSEQSVPAFVDLAARLEFAAKFDPTMTVCELQSYVSGLTVLPEKILFHVDAAGWHFELQTSHAYAAVSHGSMEVAFNDSPLIQQKFHKVFEITEGHRYDEDQPDHLITGEFAGVSMPTVVLRSSALSE